MSEDDIFVDTGVEIYGSRSEWVSTIEEDPIDEVGMPHPMGEHVLWDKNDYRYYRCARYEACLTFVRDQNWVGFACDRCEYCEVLVSPAPDHPGEGYRRDLSGNFYIPPRYRFASSSPDVCECGEHKEVSKDMCHECEKDIERVMES